MIVEYGRTEVTIYLEPDTEFSADFFSSQGFQEVIRRVKAGGKTTAVRTVKLVVAGALVLTIPLTALSGRASQESYAMSYVYFGTPAEQIRNVARAANTLDMVSPSYFDLNADGSLKLNSVSSSFMNAMRQQGLRVVPFLSNHWDRTTGRNALQNADKLVADLAAAVERYGFDGVNVDIENVTAAERDLYTDFVRKLRAALPAHKEVSVAVAANPRGYQTGWHGSYDYRGLAQYADYLFLMTYDEHYSGGPAGPVASLPFVEQSIQYALQYAKPHQVVMGIPFFGRIWGGNGAVTGMGISLAAVEDYRRTYRGSVHFDSVSASPYFTFTIAQSDPKPTLNGVTLPAGNYTIWFENADSIKQKLQLVNKYGIKGAGNWSAGQETADVWDYYELWLGGRYFADIQTHFAKDEIIRVTADGIMKGVSESLFAPGSPLTRAQAAVVAVRALGLDRQQARYAFPDTKNHWASREIAIAAQNGLVAGYDDGKFRPDASVSRAEMAVILSRMIEKTFPRAGAGFPDVPGDHWAAEEIAALAASGILRGYEDGTFRPSAEVSRGEVAVLIERMRNQ